MCIWGEAVCLCGFLLVMPMAWTTVAKSAVCTSTRMCAHMHMHAHARTYTHCNTHSNTHIQELVAGLRAFHYKAQTSAESRHMAQFGLDLVEGRVRNNVEHGVLEPTMSKTKMIQVRVCRGVLEYVCVCV